MSELLIALVAALPALAALGLIGTRSTPALGRAWRRTPRPLKLAAFAFAIAACHPSCNDYARGPVPLATLPFGEPVAYASAVSAGRPVEAQNGLLASYFAGTNYDRLDHQQVDPNVDFIWEATAQNPVIPDATLANHGLDQNHGFGEVGPPIWGIWSVVWEGYLEAAADGPYVLGVHANNGGWLEMKSAAGGLETVVANPGGPSFEGTVTATRTLGVGRHYLRLSYYQSGAPTGVARLLWQPPGATGLSAIPQTSLCTQDVAVCGLPNRAIMYVHGTTGSFRGNDFPALLDPLRGRYEVVPFIYLTDRGNADASLACLPGTQRPVPAFDRSLFGFTVDEPDPAPGICDSNDSIELNAVRLDADVAELARSVERISLIANSGGGAIVRAFLAYATLANTGTIAKIDGVFFLESVQQGTYIAALVNGVGDTQTQTPMFPPQLLDLLKGFAIHDPRRPAATDLAPKSELIQFANRRAPVPDQPHYVNVAGDIILVVKQGFFFYSWEVERHALGDLVMVPGEDDPTALPDRGGARFLPAVVGRGRSSTQWLLTREMDWIYTSIVAPFQLAAVIDAPENHLNLSRMKEICVTVPSTDPGTAHVKTLDRALVDAVTALDSSSPDPRHIGFGTRSRVACP